MEKMPSGFSYVTGDWRYSMIMPDGSLFGETRGANDERVDCPSSYKLEQSAA